MPNYEQVARQAAARAGIDPDTFVRQIRAESNFNPNARSPAGAIGIAQIMPATARGWGVDPTDPVAALNAAARAMSKYVRSYGSYRNALVAYNAGPGRVGKPLYEETRNYINKILGGKEPAKAAAPQSGGLGLSAAPTYDALGDARGKLQSARARLTPMEEEQEEDEGLDLRGRAMGLRARREALQASLATPAPVASPQAAGGAFRPAHGGANTYKDILQLGKRFGLRIDGSNQTTGGNHTAGSLHYSGRAVDFGDAKNDPAKLRALAAWAKANRHRIKEFYYDPLGWYIKNGKVIKGSIGGHGDHVHIAM